MSWMPLQFAPGINRDKTFYSERGRWYDCNLVRFRQGLPERWGGWQKYSDSLSAFSGLARSIFRHSDLSSFEWISVGTGERFYMVSDDVSYEVTPIETTATLGSDPIDVTSGSNVITINHTGAERLPGNIVIISSATGPIGGIPASEINAEHEVTSYIDDNTYTITVTTSASSTASGGGASVQVQYLYSPGSLAALAGAGWGRLTWGEEAWGETDGAGGQELGQWSQDNFGEDLVACIRNGPIFYWDATNPSNRMVNIRDLPSADSNAPTKAEFVIVSERDRHVLAFGGTQFSTGNDAPMEIRWCDQENILDWDESDPTGTAGSIALSSGSKFLSAVQTNSEILTWTTAALYSVQFVGAPNVYIHQIIEAHSDILGMNAATYYNSTVFWVGRSGFYAYTGQVDRLNSPVWDYFVQDVDFANAEKIYVSSNSTFGEVIFLYQSTSSTNDDIDSYITYNPTEDYWTIGRLNRTVWLDTDSDNTPIAVGFDRIMYEHEVGADDGSTNPPTAISAYIESAPFELSSEGAYDKGDRFAFIRRILPDVSFREFSDGVNSPTMNIVLKTLNKPGGGLTTETTSAVTRTEIVTVEKFTEDLHVRLRGRAIIVRAESSALGTLWRLGIPRVDIRSDGQR